jgi:hypothetical protein
MSSDATNEAIVRSAARLRVATFVVMTLFVVALHGGSLRPARLGRLTSTIA